MLREAFGEHYLSETVVFEWHSCFKAGWVSVDDDERSGQPSTSKTTENVDKIQELIHKDRRRTIYELAYTIGIGYGVCQILRENLNVRRTGAKFVPRLLTND
jgi:ribulose 1,5-bisphosphate carboxylase large subunit-like protein